MPTDVTAPAAKGKHWFNPFLPEFRDDPHPALHRLRAESPAHHCRYTGVWFVTRYEDVLALLRDPRLSSDTRHWEQHGRYFHRDALRDPGDAATVYARWMLQTDPPDHTRLRGLLTGVFTPRAVERIRGDVVRLTREMIATPAAGGRMDVVGDLAYPLPIAVICALLAVPTEDYEKVKAWSAALIPSLNPAMGVAGAAAVNAALREFGAYFASLARARRGQGGDDLFAHLLSAQVDGQRLTEDELVATCVLLAFAGHYSTVQLIAGLVLEVLRDPPLAARLRAEPALRAGAVEEALRHVSPLQFVYRATMEPVEVGGTTIPPKQMVFLSLAAANRDPARFPGPDRFDPTRGDNRHLSFGYGIHFCAGAALAKLEARIVLDELFGGGFDVGLAADGAIKREPSLLFRGIQSLPVRVTPRAT